MKRTLRISDSELAIAREKVVRAYKHLQVTERVIRRFVRRDCGIDTKLNRRRNEYEVVAKIPDPPPGIGLLVGDCVHNLRTALDHVVYALVMSNPDRLTNAPSKQTMFPIADTRQRYLQQVRERKRLEGVTAPVSRLIESLQPYHFRDSGADYTLHPLWVLNRLENIDKHRRLTLTSGVGSQAYVSVRDGAGGELEVAHLQSTIYDRAVLARCPAALGPVKAEGFLMVYVALEEKKELPSLAGEEICQVLHQLVNYVGNTLLPEFRRVAIGRAPARRRKRRQDLFRLPTKGK